LNSLVRFHPDAPVTSVCIKYDPATTCYVYRGNRSGLHQRNAIFLRVYCMLWFDPSNSTLHLAGKRNLMKSTFILICLQLESNMLSSLCKILRRRIEESHTANSHDYWYSNKNILSTSTSVPRAIHYFFTCRNTI